MKGLCRDRVQARSTLVFEAYGWGHTRFQMKKMKQDREEIEKHRFIENLLQSEWFQRVGQKLCTWADWNGCKRSALQSSEG